MGGQERDWDTISPLIYVRVEGGERKTNNGILEEKDGRVVKVIREDKRLALVEVWGHKL